MKLTELKTGEEGIILKVRGRGAFRIRIMEMGFIRGKNVRVEKNAPLNDPVEYSLLDYRVSLRRSEAEMIEVAPVDESMKKNSETSDTKELFKEIHRYPVSDNIIHISFVGNPNAGKTSVFNFASRSYEHTGNYSGVTIESKTAQVVLDDFQLNLTDLPGTYSLTAYSPEELFVRAHLIDSIPDVIVNVVDVSNLERNLFLTTQLIDMDVKVVLALNMYDELERRKDLLDYTMLGNLLGIPIVPTVGSKGKGTKQLLRKVIQVFSDREKVQRHIHINYGEELEKSIERIQALIKKPGNFPITDKISSRFLSIKLLENDRPIGNYLTGSVNRNEISEISVRERKRIETLYGEDTVSIFTQRRYGFISGALLETFYKNEKQQKVTTEVLDHFFTHKVFGFPFFIFFMWIMFAATFKLGKIPQNWIESGITWLGILIAGNMAESSLKDLLLHGILGGVGGVIVFLPNILILFLCISFMEDSGYMARAVFIMDRLMHKIGLHGKSFIPLLMGFGCNVPAIMATRAIEDRNSRLLTILINPLMSCSARLPVYLLLIGSFFPTFQGTMLFSLYLLGIILAVVVALVFKKTLFKSGGLPFVMELPPYRMPTARSAVRHMWNKASQYLKKMTGVILIASILLWALSYFPKNTNSRMPQIGIDRSHVFNSSTQKKNPLLPQAGKGIVTVSDESVEHQRIENSFLGRFGKFIEPAIRPLGFDWKMGVSLISGIAAKEIVVSTLGVLHHADSRGDPTNLSEKLRSEVYVTGQHKGQQVFNPVSTLSFLIFTLIYFPCIAVFAAVRQETGSFRWAVFVIIYTTILAYAASFLVYQIGKNLI